MKLLFTSGLPRIMNRRRVKCNKFCHITKYKTCTISIQERCELSGKSILWRIQNDIFCLISSNGRIQSTNAIVYPSSTCLSFITVILDMLIVLKISRIKRLLMKIQKTPYFENFRMKLRSLRNN